MARLVSSVSSFLLGAVSANITPRANILTCIAKLQRKGIKHNRFTTTKIQTRYFTGLAKIRFFQPKARNVNVMLGLSLPFSFDFDFPFSVVIHSQSQSISSADTMRTEMPIDTYIQPNKEDDRITVEIHLNRMENYLSDDQRKWVESLEVKKTSKETKVRYFICSEFSQIDVSFLSKMSPGSYPPVFCVIKVPKSLHAIEAVMLKKSNVTIRNNLSESMTVTTQGGNCALKNNQTSFVSVKTENGDCIIHDNVSTIQMVSTDSGDCDLENNKCTSMIINTNSGNCHLRNNNSTKLDATSQTGTCVWVDNRFLVARFLHGGGCRSNKGKPNVDD